MTAVDDQVSDVDDPTGGDQGASGVHPVVAAALDGATDDSHKTSSNRMLDELVKQQKESRDERQELIKGERAANTQLINQMEAGRKDLLSMPQPDLKEAKDPPSPKQLGQGLLEYVQIATALGAIAGGAARGNATVALNAFGSAVKGFTQGNRELYEASVEEWKEASQKLKQDNQNKLDQYNMVFNNKKLSMDMKLAQIRIIATQYHDEITYNIANNQDATTLGLALMKQEDMQRNLDSQDQKRRKDIELIDMKLKGGGDTRMRSGQGLATQQFVKDWKASHGGQDPPADEITKFMSKMGAQRAAATFWEGGGKGAAQLQATDTAMVHLDTIEQLSQALKSGNSRVANTLFQEIGLQFGSAPPANFTAAMALVGPELVNSITAGGGGQEERRAATALISRVSSPEQVAGVVATLKKMLAGRLGTAKRRFLQDTGGTEQEFNDRLSPEAQQLLQGGGGGGGGGGGNDPLGIR